jgi:membrane protein implicated in regulation of membrane protease activity
MNARARKAVGTFVLLAYMAIYVTVAATVGSLYAVAWPLWAQMLFFAVAGIIWIFPLKPLFGWMNRGR